MSCPLDDNFLNDGKNAPGSAWQYDLQVSREGDHIPALTIVGWVEAPPGQPAPLDIRLQILGRLILPVLEPTPTIEEQNSRILHWSATLRIEAGNHDLQLEVLNLSGHWMSVAKEHVTFPQNGSTKRIFNSFLAGPRLLRVLSETRRQLGSTLDHCMARLIEAEQSECEQRSPVAPWWGNLETPETHRAEMQHRQISVYGWLTHEHQKVSRIKAWIHPKFDSVMRQLSTRRDVAQVFPELPGAGTSGFEGVVYVPASLPQPWNLTVAATTGDGQTEVVFSRRVWGDPICLELHDQLPPRHQYKLREVLSLARHLAGGWMGIWSQRQSFRSALTTWRENATIEESTQPYSIPPPYHQQDSTRRMSVVIINDNMILGGAALFAFEYACYLRDKLEWKVRLASPEDGPLTAQCLAKGIPVDLISASTFAGLPSVEHLDLIMVNTLAVGWVVPLARSMGIPTLLYVHEGAKIANLFGAGTTAQQIATVESAIRQATCTVLITRWSMRLHARTDGQGKYRLLPSWINIAKLDEFAANQVADKLRSQLGYDSKDFIFVCLGSVCERKGQRILIRAAQWLRQFRNEPSSSFPETHILIVGAKDTPDTRQLRGEIQAAGLNEISIIPETPSALDYLLLADSYVCPSFEEGFPRSLMEAAVLSKPIVATHIPGIREMLREKDAWLVPAGDAPALAQAMRQVMLACPEAISRRCSNARRRIEDQNDASKVLPFHAALALETARPKH